MFRLTAFILLMLASATGKAQLVNGGFETHSALPSNVGQWQVVHGWNNAGSLVSSPDYYHYQSSAEADIPETPLALVDAFEGEAIMGFIACGRKHNNLREYLTAVFSEPLIVGKSYRVSFRLTNGLKTLFSTAGLAVNGLGLYFSTSQPVQQAQTPLVVTPQWTINDLFYSPEWELFTYTFEADQPYLYMTFGLFGTDDDKDIVVAEGHEPQYAYYFIDDVNLIRLPTDNRPTYDPDRRAPRPLASRPYKPTAFYVPNSFTPNGDGYNDIFIPIAGAISQWEFSVFNSWGERVFYTDDSSRGWDGNYNSKQAGNGTYVWEVKYQEFDDEIGWVLKEERGVVTLVR